MLLGAQMSVTALLLYLAGLTAHTLVRATTFDFGFDTQNVLLFHQPLPAIGADADLSRFRSNDPVFDARYEEKLRLTAQSVESLQHTPGVIGAASFFKVPLAAARRNGEPILAFPPSRRRCRPCASRSNASGGAFRRIISAS